MTREALIAKVKNNYAAADPATIEAVLAALQEAKFDWRLPEPARTADGDVQEKATISSPLLNFFGEHLSLEEYRRLSLDERGELKLQLKTRNRQWLEEKFNNLHAAWIMVMDGEVIAFDGNLDSYPQVEQIREIGSRYGKRPFIFINDLFIAVEESRFGWHSTVYPNDFYPTVEITLHAQAASLNLVADFDTGAGASFISRDLLMTHNLIEKDAEQESDASQHLGQTFKFFRQPFNVEVILPTGETLSRKLSMNCVTKWNDSPFIQINPRRIALAGRDLFLQLKPSITLDFANRRTTLAASKPT